MEIKKAAMIGMGAIGAVYGSYLYKKYGNDFAVAAGGERAKVIRTRGIKLNGDTFFPNVIAPGDNSFQPDLLILCVKNYSLDTAIEDIRGLVTQKTVILPLLNGVTAKDRLQSAFPANRVLYGLCVYVDAVRSETGVTNVSKGIIQFGDADNTVPSAEVAAVHKYLTQAGLEADACPEMLRALWKKWMLNVGCNQVSAVTGSTYGKMLIETNLLLFHEAMLEVVALARACGINLTKSDALEFEKRMQTFSPDGKTSMLQDVEAKRKTEVENFSGTVEAMGKKYHVPTPVNHVLYCLLKSKEQMYLS